MAAGLGFKTFTTGEVLTAGDVNGYLMQGILVFASTAARNAAITSPQEGQFAFTKDTNGLWYYDGSAWVASGATGDIEGVTAGVGISGGGTSGTVTITNSMATAIDAKGDLVVGTGADTFSRLAVGANGTTLVADSAEATGLKWQAASSASFKGVSCWQSTDISISNDTTTAITWNSEAFDTDAFHSTSTNTGRITIPSGLGGKYHINGCVSFVAGGAGFRRVDIFKNGSIFVYGANIASASASGGTQMIPFSVLLDLVATDYISISVSQSSGGTINTLGGQSFGQFNATFLGA